MANNKQRYINTRLWNDTYVATLDPIEKLLFVYLLTNEHTNISGIYEIPLKILAIETGLDESMLKKIFARLSDKINYVDGKVVIKNFIKHQETGSVNVKKGILNCLKELDIKFVESVVNKGLYILPQYYLDTLCIPYVEGSNYLHLDLDSNLDLDSIKNKKPEEVVKKEIHKSEKEILSFWNSFKVTVHKENPTLLEDVKKALKKFTSEEIKTSITNYAETFSAEETYFKHKWTLQEFLSRKNALPVFLYKTKADYLKDGNKIIHETLTA